MHGKPSRVFTKELGEIKFKISKAEVTDILKSKNIKYDETPRTITAYAGKDEQETLATKENPETETTETLVYIIFNDNLDEIALIDLCNTSLEKIELDGKIYSAEEIKDTKQFKTEDKVLCERSGKFVRLDKNLNCIGCSQGVARENCLGAGEVYHDIKLDESIITYIDYGDSTDSENKMFCIENNHGDEVDFNKIQKEERQEN